MSNKEYSITYPRKQFQRGFLRSLGRLVLPVAFNLRITGVENFPKSGPLIVAGNHSSAMEVVMMSVFTPWQVEMLAGAEIPPDEHFYEVVKNFFGFIPIKRGQMDRQALKQCLDTLSQNGIVGIFPEGGIWEPGVKTAHNGVAWLSHRSGAPVLPIYFGGSIGAIGNAVRLKRPKITMDIGKVLAPATVPDGMSRKVYFQHYATEVMEAVRGLMPPDMPEEQAVIIDERFEFDFIVYNHVGEEIEVQHLTIDHPAALAKFLHRPGILKVFRSNLRLRTGVLEHLHQERNAREITNALQLVLNYLNDDNPAFLTYRFGREQGKAMQRGLEELHTLATWVADSHATLHLKPIRRYHLPDQAEEIVQIKQEKFRK